MGLLTKKRQKAFTSQATWTLVKGQWLTPDDKNDTYIDLGYKTLPNVYGIISAITQLSSSVPFDVMRIKDKRKYFEYKSTLKNATSEKGLIKSLRLKHQALDKVEDSDLERLLMKPNEVDTYQELMEKFDGYLLLTGNSFMLSHTPGMGPDAKKPTELQVIPSTLVELVTQGLDVSGYKISYYEEEIDKERIAHMKYFNPINSSELVQNQLYGMSPLASCRNLMKKYEKADIAQGAMFTNMAPAGILSGEGDGSLQEQEAKDVHDAYYQTYSGEGKAGKVIVTPGKLHWTEIGFSPTDLNIIEGKREMLSEICNAYKYPIGMVTELNSTDNNMDNARKQVLTDCVIPLTDRRFDRLNKWLTPQFGDDLLLVPNYSVFDVLQEDLKSKAEWVSKIWQLSPNTVLQIMEQETSEDPNMNKVYAPSGLVPLEDLSMEVEPLDEELINGEPN